MTETGQDRWLLIVEDNSGDVALIRHALKSHGVDCKVVVMTDGERASRFIDETGDDANGCPELIILDLNLPKKTGRELLQEVRSSAACKDIPVVVFSSSEAETDRQESLRLGANMYITKPSNLDDFLKIGGVIKSIIEKPKNN